MKFRLTYEGKLRPTGNEPKEETNRLANHKHGIRRHFHKQLKFLWETDRFLSEYTVPPKHWKEQVPAADSIYARWAPDPTEMIPLRKAVEVAAEYHQYGYRFVPLVLERFSLLCSLKILLLRRDIPDKVISAGDIDNRVKTLIDALRMPKSANELVHDDAKPGPGEDPFFCLLEDDLQVSDFFVETDTLLDPQADDKTAKLVVTVELRPYYVTTLNLNFV